MFQRTLKIAHIQRTHIFLKSYTFNVHYYSKKLHNNICSKYAIFLNNDQSFVHSMYTTFQKWIAHSKNTMSQTIYISKWKLCNFSNNAQNSALSTYTQLQKEST